MSRVEYLITIDRICLLDAWKKVETYSPNCWFGGDLPMAQSLVFRNSSSHTLQILTSLFMEDSVQTHHARQWNWHSWQIAMDHTSRPLNDCILTKESWSTRLGKILVDSLQKSSYRNHWGKGSFSYELPGFYIYIYLRWLFGFFFHQQWCIFLEGFYPMNQQRVTKISWSPP